MKKERLRVFLLTLAILFAYCNAPFLDYALDDRLVIFENDYTLKGFDGVKEIMTKDSFSGYFGNDKNLVAGGRYRPMAQLTFLLEYELFGNSIKDKVGLNRAPQNEALFTGTILPFISHLNNILLYIALCLIIYFLLKRLFPSFDNKKWFLSLPFLAALLFSIHPIHTEVITNIKSRDEILSALGAFVALYFTLKYIDTKKWLFLPASFAAFTFALFSKENAITFLAVIPLVLFFINKQTSIKQYLITLIPLILSTILFLWARYNALGAFMPEDTTQNILNNPFIGSSTAQQIATVIFTWAIYLKLFLFPHPLTHDYYPKQIAITDFHNPLVWLILLFFISLAIYALIKLRKRSCLSFAILFFFCTFSITSNLLFNIGTFMNERFVFVPLLGFTIAIAYFVNKTSRLKKQLFIIPSVLVVIFCLFEVKCFTRNMTWKNDITLFTKDVLVSDNSIKCNISAGGSYLKLYKQTHKNSDLNNAQKYLDKAIKLDKLTFNAHLLLGELFYLKEDYQTSYQYYKNAFTINPDNVTAKENMDIALQALNNSGLTFAERELENGNIDKALQYVDDYIQKNPNSANGYNLKGKIYGKGKNDLKTSIYYLEKAIALDSTFSSAYENLGVAYAIMGNFNEAVSNLQKALLYSPNNKNILTNLSNVYSNMGNKAKSEEYKNLANKQ